MPRKPRRTLADPASGSRPTALPRVLPLGALLLAGSFGVQAQSPAPPAPSSGPSLPTVTVKDKPEPEETKNKSTLRATKATVAKGRQDLKDVPQTVTVVTEMLIDDRNLDDFREVLRTVAGVSFLAGETGEEDVRLRGFSLGQAGDIYVDGLKDAPLIERDTFNHDRIEVLKGSASMLFGKGSTGGVVNQVSKQPFLADRHEFDVTLGTGKERRAAADLNFRTGDDAAVRLNAMLHKADHDGATVDKKGIAPTFRWGIGLADEFSAGLFHLETDGRPIYNHPWFVIDGRLRTTVPARNYYGLASDYLRTESTYGTLSHIHRFDAKTELKTTLRHGRFERDLWVSAIGFAPAAFQPGGVAATIDTLSDATVLQRNPKGRRAESDLTQLQSELTADFDALGRRHSVIAGVDFYFEDAKRANNYAGAASGIRTTLDTPNDGATREDPRAAPVFNTFDADNAAIFVQDTITIAPRWKAVAGLRLDRFKASYVTAGTTAANGTVTPSTVFSTSENLWSPRAGLLFQPDEATTWYVSYGTSYNTSGDTYQYTPGNPNLRDANTPPEKSRNVEAGAKFDLANGAASVAVAAFRSEKYNERNTDPDSAAQQNLLSGKRHATGMELSVAGRLTPRWEIFYNHTWIPSARIDRSNVALNAAGTGAQVEGDRPGLTPKHSASLWSTYRLNHAIRLGLGVNHRGEQNPEGARHVTAPAFTTVDAMAEYSLGEDTTVKLSGTNLGDKRYADALYRGFYAPGAPRAVQVTLRTTF